MSGISRIRTIICGNHIIMKKNTLEVCFCKTRDVHDVHDVTIEIDSTNSLSMSIFECIEFM